MAGLVAFPHMNIYREIIIFRPLNNHYSLYICGLCLLKLKLSSIAVRYNNTKLNALFNVYFITRFLFHLEPLFDAYPNLNLTLNQANKPDYSTPSF